MLYATAGAEDGRVYLVSLSSARIDATIPVGHTPVSPIVSPDERWLYVCNRFNNNVAFVDLQKKIVAENIPAKREPVAAALMDDGKTLIVANLLPLAPSTADDVAAELTIIDTRSRRTSAVRLPVGSTSVRGICISPGGQFAYVVHTLARYQLPTMQLNRGWMNSSALSIIDLKSRKLLRSISLDDEHLGAASPWDVACSRDGQFLCISHAGTSEISVIQRGELHKKLAAPYKHQENSTQPYSGLDFSFLAGIRSRVKLPGNGPRALAIAAGKVFTVQFFSDDLAVVELSDQKDSKARSVSLGPKPPLSVARRGEMLFNNAENCFEQWQSCASCHPDGRADALNWDLLNDGIGNPKNTKSLLLTHQTPPSMSLGIRKCAEDAVRSGIKYIEFADWPEEDARAIDEYLKSLKPVSSPYLVRGKLSEAAERGKVVFERQGCAVCHPAPLFTNLKQYNIGTGTGTEKESSFDVPTLIELWRTAPYLHDGRTTTLDEAIPKHKTSHPLSEKDRHALVQYLLSL